jgi:hypothetical protein
VNEYTINQLKKDPNGFSKQEQELENKVFYQT